MMTSIFRYSLLVVALSTLAGCASLGRQPSIRADVVTRTDGMVRLLHKGSGDPGNLYCIGETVPVYRWYAGGRFVKYRETGKAKITRYLEAGYLEGAVVEGDVREGDVIRKSEACRQSGK